MAVKQDGKFKFSFNEKRILVTLQKQLSIAATLHKRHFDRSFRNQGFTNKVLKKWKPRKRSDAFYGRKSKGARAILVQTSILSRSINKQRFGRFTWKIISETPYSAIHNYGGTTHPTVTPKMRAWAIYMFKKTGQSFFLSLATTKKEKLTVNIPQRQFMGISEMMVSKTTKDITKALRSLI